MPKSISLTNPDSPVKKAKGRSSNGGHPTGRVSKQQWLEAALETLISDGVEAVRVADLAKQLKISKSGFYWHFKNREDLLESMKTYWVDEFSQQIISNVLIAEIPTREKLAKVVRMIRMKQSSKLDLAFTSWALRDPSLRKMVDQVRDLRIDFIKKLLSERGLSGEEIEARARLFVVYFSWSTNLFPQQVDEGTGEPLNEILNMICSSSAHLSPPSSVH